MDGAFEDRELIPNVPMESRPVLLRTSEAMAAWLANPTSAELAMQLIAEPDSTEE